MIRHLIPRVEGGAGPLMRALHLYPQPNAIQAARHIGLSVDRIGVPTRLPVIDQPLPRGVRPQDAQGKARRSRLLRRVLRKPPVFVQQLQRQFDRRRHGVIV